MSAIPALSIAGLHKSITAGSSGCCLTAALLRGISFTVAPGEIVVVRGTCALTVTTLLRCAAGLLRPDAGQVRWFGRFPALAEPHFVPTYVDAARLAPFRDRASARLVIVDGPLDASHDQALGALLRIARRDGIAVLAAGTDGMSSPGLAHRVITLRDGGVAMDPLRPPTYRVAEPPPPRPFG